MLKLIPAKNKHVTKGSTAEPGSKRAFGEQFQDIITIMLRISSSHEFNT